MRRPFSTVCGLRVNNPRNEKSGVRKGGGVRKRENSVDARWSDVLPQQTLLVDVGRGRTQRDWLDHARRPCILLTGRFQHRSDGCPLLLHRHVYGVQYDQYGIAPQAFRDERDGTASGERVENFGPLPTAGQNARPDQLRWEHREMLAGKTCDRNRPDRSLVLPQPVIPLGSRAKPPTLGAGSRGRVPLLAEARPTARRDRFVQSVGVVVIIFPLAQKEEVLVALRRPVSTLSGLGFGLCQMMSLRKYQPSACRARAARQGRPTRSPAFTPARRALSLSA